jgi:hypothetical protein
VIRVAFDVLIALAALVAILDYFGVKPKQPMWGLSMPLNRNWKLAMMLSLVASSLVFSGYGYYRSSRPLIVERIVEKPVDRIVEKPVERIVQRDCPAPTKFRPSAIPTKASPPPGAATTSPVVIPPNTKIEATTKAPNSAAVGINTGTVTVNPEVNPNQATKVYNCAGIWKTVGPSEHASVEISSPHTEKIPVYKKMAELNNTKDWTGLLRTCSAEIKSTPEWLAPYVFCSMSNLALGNRTKALELLDYYDAHKGTAYGDACEQIGDYIRSGLQRGGP